MDNNEKKFTVLIVDDTVENVDVLNGMLSEKYKIKVALGGEKALKIAEKKPPDIILLDVMMPEMDGYEVCRRLKANEATQGIPVIFVTGHQDEEEKEKGMALGAVDYLVKPVEPELVFEKLRLYLKA